RDRPPHHRSSEEGSASWASAEHVFSWPWLSPSRYLGVVSRFFRFTLRLSTPSCSRCISGDGAGTSGGNLVEKICTLTPTRSAARNGDLVGNVSLKYFDSFPSSTAGKTVLPSSLTCGFSKYTIS